ncbi:hypothetical protein KEJ37_07680 [Candidatus Bathyarchaeota archaeon]|nr:hypothetical protein [Candidatus Bathyarchaeota archaeon]
MSSDFRRTVIDVQGLAREFWKLAPLNALRIYQLANTIIEDYLKDGERLKP